MIVTEWPVFKTLDWQRIKHSMLRPLILDGRNLLNGDEMAALGFEYQGVGKPMDEAVHASLRRRSSGSNCHCRPALLARGICFEQSP